MWTLQTMKTLDMVFITSDSNQALLGGEVFPALIFMEYNVDFTLFIWIFFELWWFFKFGHETWTLFCFCRKFFNGARMGTCCTTFTQPFNEIFSTTMVILAICVVCYITSLLTVLPFSTRNSIIDGWFLMVCWWISKWRHCRERYKTIKSFHICVQTLK